MARKSGFNRTKANVYVDLAIALAFVVEMEVGFTGLHIHELLGLAFAAAALVHIILHWGWIVGITRHFFAKLFHESRLNYLLNAALFVDMVIVVISGIVISRTVGISLSGTLTSVIEPIHFISSYAVLIIVGLHVGLHWKWIVTNAQKYLLQPVTSLTQPRQAPRSADSSAD